MIHQTVRVVENAPMAERTYRLRLACPEVAARIRPGQFLMLRLPRTTDPLLGRPFALYDTVLENDKPVAIDVVYLVVGKMTAQLAAMSAGETLEVWGPLGQPFLDVGCPPRVTLVAGGIGQTPFLAYARELLGTRGYGGDPPRARTAAVALYYGVRTAQLAAGIDDFRAAGVELHLASDDGSLGSQGYVTQLLEAHGKTGPLVGCGPEPMLHALAQLARKWGVPCQVALETPMACGIGICFSCVTKVRTTDGWDYKRVCVDGPCFDAAQWMWDESAPSEELFKN
ncbi:MAG: dihydroorotate dehydrogenase electron transfer subunit [Gemmataceae bacterium]|nr:dihydroorotate dehydrogenase electron transfer subunit [Gemmata sp.]MDW8196345.1 dihydroorotate dehydrogenase electron transfer subunit [Gemmataceae bacterium]